MLAAPLPFPGFSRLRRSLGARSAPPLTTRSRPGGGCSAGRFRNQEARQRPCRGGRSRQRACRNAPAGLVSGANETSSELASDGAGAGRCGGTSAPLEPPCANALGNGHQGGTERGRPPRPSPGDVSTAAEGAERPERGAWFERRQRRLSSSRKAASPPFERQRAAAGRAGGGFQQDSIVAVSGVAAQSYSNVYIWLEMNVSSRKNRK
jgi:hypothetical protein